MSYVPPPANPPTPPIPTPPPVPPRSGTSPAVIAFVGSLVGLFSCPFIGAWLGVYYGRRALAAMNVPGSDQSERGLATTAVIFGWFQVAFSIFLLVFFGTGILSFLLMLVPFFASLF